MKKAVIAIFILLLIGAIASLAYVYRCPVLKICTDGEEALDTDERSMPDNQSAVDGAENEAKEDSRTVTNPGLPEPPPYYGISVEEKNCNPHKYTQPGEEEDPDEVVVKYFETWLENDLDYMYAHHYCDEDCQSRVFELTGMCMDEFEGADYWAVRWEKARELIGVEATSTRRTEIEAVYETLVKFREDVGDSGRERWLERETGGEIVFKKIGNLWATDVADETFGSNLAVMSNINQLRNGLYACLKAGTVEWDVPREGGEFRIEDENHPLYGFSASFPEIPEAFRLSVGCHDRFPEYGYYDMWVSLPIRMSADIAEDTVNTYLDEKREQDMQAGNLSALMEGISFSLPYYDTAFNDDTYSAIGGDTIVRYDSDMNPAGGVMTEGHDARLNVFEVLSSDFVSDSVMVAILPVFYLQPIDVDKHKVVDSDSDGIADNIELLLGTDPDSADSDEDGYPDKEEIRGGYDPVGAGRLFQAADKQENFILFSVLGPPTFNPSADGPPRKICSKLYYYDPVNDRLNLISDSASRNFVFSEQDNTVLFGRMECGAEYGESEDIRVQYDLATGQSSEVDRSSMVVARLNTGLWLEVDIDDAFMVTNYNLRLYNPDNDRHMSLEGFPGTWPCTPSSDGIRLYCLSRSRSFVYDMLADKIENEFDIQALLNSISVDEKYVSFYDSDLKGSSLYEFDLANGTKKSLASFSMENEWMIGTSLGKPLKSDFFKLISGKMKEGSMGIDPDTTRMRIFRQGQGVVKEISPEDYKKYFSDMSDPSVLSPDGKKIAFSLRREDQTGELVIVNLETKTSTTILETGGSLSQLEWH